MIRVAAALLILLALTAPSLSATAPTTKRAPMPTPKEVRLTPPPNQFATVTPIPTFGPLPPLPTRTPPK